MASTVASYVAVVEAGPYLTSVDIRPNTLCKGGSIKTTLYDPCFRSTTVVQGFPAVYSFFLALRNATFFFKFSSLSFYFLTLLPLSCIRGLSTNFLDGGASVKGHPKMLPVTASRHPDSEMMVVPGFPASHHHRLSLFLLLFVYQQVSKLVLLWGHRNLTCTFVVSGGVHPSNCRH